MSSHSVPLQVTMRIVASAMYFYDFIVTVPSELRLYRRQRGRKHVSHACMLFVASRYLGLATVISGMAVYFGKLSTSQCARVFPLVGAMRCILSTVTSLVLLWRTWAIWSRKSSILFFMGLALIPTTVFSYGFLFVQKPHSADGRCTGYTDRPQFILGSKWAFALFNLVYDLLACVVSSVRLVAGIRRKHGSSPLYRILLSDGIGYFIVAACGHALNLAFLLSQSPERETVFSLFNAALSAIVAQRIILALTERVVERLDSPPSTRPRNTQQRRQSIGLRTVGGGPLAINVHTETVRDADGRVSVDDGSVFDDTKKNGAETPIERHKRAVARSEAQIVFQAI